MQNPIPVNWTPQKRTPSMAIVPTTVRITETLLTDKRGSNLGYRDNKL